MSSLDKDEYLKNETEELEKVKFGNLVQCHFNEHG